MNTPAIQDATLQELQLEEINLAVYNPRQDLKPGDKAWKDIERSMIQYGNLGGMVWNRRTKNLVAGHQRVKILRHHGRTSSIFAVVDFDEDAEKALNIALNRLGEGAWDRGRLSSLLTELQAKSFDLESLGFKRADLAHILKKPAKKHALDPDKVPSLTEATLTNEGDVYDIVTATCHHRLICGDSRSLPVLDRLMEGRKAKMIHTDPPYGVAYNQAGRPKGSKVDLGKVLNDDLQHVALVALLTDLLKNAAACSIDAAPLYCWHAAGKRRAFYEALDAAGWDDFQELVWAKTLMLSRAHYHWSHEPCFYARKHNQRPTWYGDRKQTTMFADTTPDWRNMTKEQAIAHLRTLYEEQATAQRSGRDSALELIHPTQKPIAIPMRAISNSSEAGDIVLDVCGGSGSTAIAAEELDRHAYLCDNDPRYVDLIVRRFFLTYEQPPQILRNGQQITAETVNQAVQHASKPKRRTKTPAA